MITAKSDLQADPFHTKLFIKITIDILTKNQKISLYS
jgi:hypothetical protein